MKDEKSSYMSKNTFTVLSSPPTPIVATSTQELRGMVLIYQPFNYTESQTNKY